MTTEALDIMRLDASQTVLFERDLEAVLTTTYDVPYPTLKFASGELVPINPEGYTGFADTITYYIYDKSGQFNAISDYSKGLPRCDVAGRRVTNPSIPHGASFGYTIIEIQRAQMAGMPLEIRKAEAVRRAYMERLERLALFGDAEYGLPGILTNPNIPRILSTTPISAASTADQIIDLISRVVSAPIAGTLQIANPNRLLLPIVQYQHMRDRLVSTAGSKSILQFIVETQKLGNPSFEIMPYWGMAGGGTSGADCMLLYELNPMKISLRIPVPITFQPPQVSGLEYVVPAYAMLGGAICYYPAEMRIVEGI
jgi:hypothetical protein